MNHTQSGLSIKYGKCNGREWVCFASKIILLGMRVRRGAFFFVFQYSCFICYYLGKFSIFSSQNTQKPIIICKKI